MKKNYIWLLMLFVFSFSNAQVGTTCEDPIVIESLPFSTTDNTANYADNYDPQTVTHPVCAGGTNGNYYHGGNDVIYSFTPTADASVNFRLPSVVAWTGMFIYTDCANIGISYAACSTSAAAGNREINDFAVTAGQTYYILISTWPTPQTFAYTLNVTENTCTNATATYTVVSDCANGPQFMVDVDITSLGTATSLTVSDNQGSATQAVSATGVVTFGPYPNATSVIFTVQNDQDASCLLTSPARTQAVCPPANDTCATAIDLSNETSPLSATTQGSTNTNTTVCNNSGVEVANTYGEVYYSIVVPNGSTLTIGQTVNNYDSANVVFYGDCDNRTSIACFDDDDVTQVQWANDTGSEQTVYWVQDGWSGTGTFTLAWSVIACTPAEATYTVVSDCANGEQFLVDVNVTNMGSATSITVSDDQGSAPQSVSAAGIVTFGPYPNATPVIFTVVNDQDDNCTLTSPARTQTVCPPVNDTCATAIDLTNETSPLMSTTVGATNTNLFVCNYEGTQIANIYADVYYSIVVPDGSLLTIGQTVNNYDSANIVFYGDCDNRTPIACFDDSDTTQVVWANDTGSEQTVYWVQDGWSGQGTFTLAWSVIACTPSEATYTVVSDCANGEQFLVDVDVTNLGSATSVTVSDNQGSAPQTVSATGIVTFGPYPNATSVIFTVVNDQDDNCTLTSPARTQAVCPPNCDEAQVITACDEEHTAVFAAGNGAWNVASCGWSTPGVENIYSFTPAETGAYELEILSVTPNFSYVDYFYKEASGSCDNTGWTCIDDLSTATTKAIGTLTAGVEYLFLIDSEGTTERTHVFKIKCLPTCTNGTSTYAVVSDCQNGEQFMVDVNVTSLGTATSVTVSDNQGSATQNTTATGILTFGPYPNNTPVIFTVANDQDETCVWTSPTTTQTACPPSNDNFADAIAVECGMTYSGNTNLATLDEDNAPDGGGADLDGRNVWYSYTGSGTPQTVTLNFCQSSYDTSVLVYTGTSGNLTFVAANDDGYACGDASLDTRSYLNFESDGTTTYYITVEGWNFGSSGAYVMAMTCATVTPPAVENQSCDLALQIAVDGTSTASDNSFGTVNPTQPSCDTFGSIQDVWFSFIAPTSGSVECAVVNGTMTSANFNIYSGDCSALVPVTGTCNTNLTTGGTEDLTGLVAGNTYFVQVWSSSTEQGTFSVTVTDEELGVNGNISSGFKAYPNPVKDVLNLSYTQNISNVEVFNMLGQQVIAKSVNATQGQVDMSNLSMGSYLVRITAENQVKTIKVIKQ